MIKDFFLIKKIENAKKTKNITNQILTLIIASLIMAIASTILIIKTNLQFNLISTAIITFVTFFISIILTSIVYWITLNILTKKGTFYDSLTAITQTSIICTMGTLITTIMLLIPSIGYILGLITMFTTIIISISIFFRAMNIMIGIDNIQIIIATIIILTALIIATQLIVSIQLLSEVPYIDMLNQTTNFAIDTTNLTQ